MQTRYSNAVILFSIIGIILVMVYNTWNQKNTSLIQDRPTEFDSESFKEPTTQPQIDTDPPQTCEHDYFSFLPGSTWVYSVDTLSQDANQKEQTESDTISILLTDLSEDSVMFEATTSNGTVHETSMHCRAGGVYGFPLPLLPSSETSDLPVLSVIDQIQGSFTLVPHEFTQDSRWQSDLSVGTSIPFIGDISLQLDHQVTQIDGGVADITAILDTSKLGITQKTGTTSITYKLEKTIGIQEFHVEVLGGDIGKIDVLYKLDTFTPPDATPSGSL